MRTALYSQPPSVTHGPFSRCTVLMAVVIVPMSAAAATGVRKPSASSAPPAVSATPATVAWRLPGRIPRLSKNPPVPSSPGPPNQPASFWSPWPMNSRPTSVRRISLTMRTS